MEKRQLGRTDLQVSKICLGTMTFGEQNTEAEAFEQLDYATANGVNFIDTAEIYAVPTKAETYTKTEQIVGNWLADRGKRDQLVIATKVAGPSGAGGLKYIRETGPRLSKDHIQQAVEGSLKRLKTDYIDLYQLHWPERHSNFFGQLGVESLKDAEDAVALAESLEAMDQLVKAGKVRHIGVSNESAWGTMTYLHLAEKHGWTRIASSQNSYSLLNRMYEVGMSEVSLREQVSLLAYSPLAMGLLSGKYRHGARPAKARLTEFTENFPRFLDDDIAVVVEKYAQLAEAHGMSLATMSQAFVNDRSFVTSNIIGATSMAQLKENIASADISLSKELLKEIGEIHKIHSNPCP